MEQNSEPGCITIDSSKPQFSILKQVVNNLIYSRIFMQIRRFYLFQKLKELYPVRFLWMTISDGGDTERSDFWTGSKQRLRELTYGVNAEDEDEWARTGNDYVEYILDELPIMHQSSWRVLEIGWGGGRVLGQMADHFDDITGVDFSPDMVRYSTERFRDRQNIRIYRNDGKSLPFEDESLDLVYSVLVFQHMNQEAIEAYFHEVKRVLRPGGFFRFQTRWDVERRNSNYMDRYFLSREDVEGYAKKLDFEIVNFQKGLGHEWFHWFTLRRLSVD